KFSAAAAVCDPEDPRSHLPGHSKVQAGDPPHRKPAVLLDGRYRLARPFFCLLGHRSLLTFGTARHPIVLRAAIPLGIGNPRNRIVRAVLSNVPAHNKHQLSLDLQSLPWT